MCPVPPQIIHINLTSESPQPLTPGAALTFTYSVQWKASSIPFVRRFERYLDFNFFEHQVQRREGAVVCAWTSTPTLGLPTCAP